MTLSDFIVDLDNVEPRPVLARYNTDHGIPSFDLFDNGYWYEIETSRCDTAAKLVDWIAHLSEKVWVTTEHIRQLVEMVSAHFDVREYA